MIEIESQEENDMLNTLTPNRFDFDIDFALLQSMFLLQSGSGPELLRRETASTAGFTPPFLSLTLKRK